MKRGPSPRLSSELAQSRTIRSTNDEWQEVQDVAKDLGLRGASDLLRASVRLVRKLGLHEVRRLLD